MHQRETKSWCMHLKNAHREIETEMSAFHHVFIIWLQLLSSMCLLLSWFTGHQLFVSIEQLIFLTGSDWNIKYLNCRFLDFWLKLAQQLDGNLAYEDQRAAVMSPVTDFPLIINQIAVETSWARGSLSVIYLIPAYMSFNLHSTTVCYETWLFIGAIKGFLTTF